jgi:hypothetical protein
MSRRGKALARLQRPRLDSQALRRELQKALAVAKCIRLAVEYGENNDGLDVADALAGLLILMDGTAALLDPPEVSP